MTTDLAISPPKKLNKMERNKAAILAAIIAGDHPRDIATKYHVGKDAINGFKRRYAVVLAQARAEVEQQVTDYAIASKVNRIAAKDRRWQLLEYLRQERAAGRSGEDSGLVARQEKYYGRGEDRELIIEFRLDGELMAAMERAEKSAAEELGQLPKTGDQFVFVGDQQQVNFFDREQALKLAQALLDEKGLNGNSRRTGYGIPPGGTQSSTEE